LYEKIIRLHPEAHTEEFKNIAADSPDFFVEWVGGLPGQKYLHNKNSTTYKMLKINY